MHPALTDSLVIVNGPQDGTAHALIRTRISVGADRNCDIILMQDDDVRDRHAEVFATRSGFRVRCLPGGVMRINGKRTGRIGTRLLRDGDIVEFGNTELMVQSIDGGRAAEFAEDNGKQKSPVRYVTGAFGAVVLTISALWYALADALHVFGSIALRLARALLERRRLMIRLSVVAICIAAYVFLPGIRRVIDAALFAATEYLNFAAQSIAQLTGR